MIEVHSKRGPVRALQAKCSCLAGGSEQRGGAGQIEQSGCQLQGSVALLVCCAAAQQDGQAARQLQGPGCTRAACLALQTLVGSSCHLQMQNESPAGHRQLAVHCAVSIMLPVRVRGANGMVPPQQPGCGGIVGAWSSKRHLVRGRHSSRAVAGQQGIKFWCCDSCSGEHLTWGRGSISSRACRACSCLAAASCDPAVFRPPRAGSLPLRRHCIWWAGSAKTVASHGTAAATTCACPALHRCDASAELACRLDLSLCPAAAGARGSNALLAQVALSHNLMNMHTQLL